MSSNKFLAVVVLALGTVGQAATLGARAPNAECARSHIVQSGETCNGISISQGVSTFQLAFVNPQINAGCTNLTPSELLCLGIVGQDCTSVHQVISGDICSNIAAAAGIPLATLLANNPNVNAGCTNLSVGEVLCTANRVINYVDTA